VVERIEPLTGWRKVETNERNGSGLAAGPLASISCNAANMAVLLFRLSNAILKPWLRLWEPVARTLI